MRATETPPQMVHKIESGDITFPLSVEYGRSIGHNAGITNHSSFSFVPLAAPDVVEGMGGRPLGPGTNVVELS